MPDTALIGFFHASLFFFSLLSRSPPHLTLFTLTCRHERNEEHRRHGIMETTRRGRGAAGACTRGDNYGSASLMRDPPSSFPVGRPHARTYIRQEPLRERIEHGSSLQTMTRGVGEGRDRTPGKPMTRCKSSVGFRIATISRTLPTCTPRDKRTSLELRMMHRLPCTITKMMHWIRRVIRGREEEGV